MSDKELIQKYAKDPENPVIGDFSSFTNFSGIPTEVRKRSWVPNWLWSLVSEKYFPVTKEERHAIDVALFKFLVAQTKRDALPIAQFLVDSGIGAWKPGYGPESFKD